MTIPSKQQWALAHKMMAYAEVRADQEGWDYIAESLTTSAIANDFAAEGIVSWRVARWTYDRFVANIRRECAEVMSAVA